MEIKIVEGEESKAAPDNAVVESSMKGVMYGRGTDAETSDRKD